MTIDEAIAYLNRILATIETDSDKYCAVRLGIEALERVKQIREFQQEVFTVYPDYPFLLPSEGEK